MLLSMNKIRVFFILLCITISISAKAETYVVCVGISNYKNISSLRLPDNDAKSIAAVYKTHTKNVILISGKYATHETILKALNDQFKRARKEDQIVFFFSGHGYEGGFCPYDMEAKYKNGLSYQEIYAAFKQSKASRKIILADACFSGGLRKNNKETKPTTSSNVLLFLSSRTNETSIETPKMKNGFFTAYLERGLRGGADVNKDKIITAKELYDYVSSNVRKISRDKQHPVMWGNFNNNLILVDWRT